jgi:hypothetical protein
MMYGNPEGAAFGIYPKAGKRSEDKQDREAAKNFPVDLARGLTAGFLGMPADILNFPGAIYSAVTDKDSYKIPYGSEDILKSLPLGSDTPTGQFASGLGTLIGGSANIGPAIRGVKALPGALKTAARNVSAPRTLDPQAGVVRVGRPSAPQDKALSLAQQRAALPIEKGGLGLPANNTPEQRAEAMGYIDYLHGTQRMDRLLEGKKLDPRRATSGPMPYGTTTPELASSYAMSKADTSRRAMDEGDVRRYFEVAPKDIGVKGLRTPIPVEQAWNFMSPEQKARISNLAPRVGYEDLDQFTGEFIVHPEGVNATLSPSQWDWFMKNEAKGNPLTALRNMWYESGQLVDEPEKLGDIYRLAGVEAPISQTNAPWTEAQGVLLGKATITNPIDTSNTEQIAALIEPLKQAFAKDRSRTKTGGPDQWAKDSRYTPKSWVSELEKDIAENKESYVWTSIPDKVTEELIRLGFNGIIDRSGKGGGAKEPVVIPFNPDQVRSRFAAFDPFRKTAATAAAMGVAAPDLLAEEAPSQPVHFSDNPDVMQLELAKGGAVAALKRLVRAPAKSKQEIEAIAERMAPQVTGEYVRKDAKSAKTVAGKTQKQFQREKTLPVDVRPTAEERVPELVDIEKLKGDVMIGIPGDPTLTGKTLYSVGDFTLGSPSPQHGGPLYGLYNDDAFWASGIGPARGVQNLAKRASKQYDAPVKGNYIMMGPDSINYAQHFADANLQAIDLSRMTKAQVDQFNELIRKGSPKSGPRESFPGIEDKDSAYLQMAMDPELRKHFNALMQMPTVTETLNLPSGTDIRFAITEPSLRDLETGVTGYSMGKMRPDIASKELPLSTHPTYDYDIPGEFMGQSRYPMPYELSFPDTLQSIRANPKQARQEFGSLKMVGPRQIVDQQMIDEIKAYEERMKQLTGKKAGGAVRKAAGGEITADDLILEERKL